MTAFDEFVRGRVEAITQRTGQITVILRRVTRTSGPNPSQHPPTVVDIAFGAAAAGGAGAITLSAAGARGRIAAGDILVVTGHPTPYTVTAPVDAVGGVFSAVPITPTIATLVASGTTPTMQWSSDTTLLARVSSYPSRMVDGETIIATDSAVIVPGTQLSRKPSPGDQLIIYADGPSEPPEMKVVVNTARDYVQDLVGRWTIQARDR